MRIYTLKELEQKKPSAWTHRGTQRESYLNPKMHACNCSARIRTHHIHFESDEWYVSHTKNREEESKFAEEVGFEHVCCSEKDEVAIYWKRK